MEGIAVTPSQLISIVRRRWRSFLLTFAVVMIFGGTLAFFLPPKYRSTATILVEEADAPSSVAGNASSYAEHRIHQLTQRIMTFPRLMEVIDRHGLYSDLRSDRTAEDLVERMRKDTELKLVSAENYDPRFGRTTTGTIAFTLSYHGPERETVMKVTHHLAALYLEENRKIRTQRAEETTDFLEAETSRLKQELAGIEAKISAFKKMHLASLPEFMQLNLQTLAGIERNIEQVSEQLRIQREREGSLQVQISGVKPYAEREEDLLRKRRLEDLQVQLVALRQRFSEDHPDVKKARAEITELERRASTLSSDKTRGEPDNPVYVALSAQLAGVRVEIQGLQRQLEKLKGEAAEYKRRISATPKVEEEYNALLAIRDSTQAKVNEMMRKLMDAQVSRGLEKEQRGERFALIEPPRLPEKPFKPNRILIMILAFLCGLGIGGGVVALREVTDDTVHSADQLESTGFPVLAGIPRIGKASS